MDQIPQHRRGIVGKVCHFAGTVGTGALRGVATAEGKNSREEAFLLGYWF
jgi:hypothetical protein